MSYFSVKKISIVVIFMCFALFMSACAPTLIIQKDFIPVGSLRMAQVTLIKKRAELMLPGWKSTYDALIASGIKDTDIVDGSVVLARIYCCGGTPERADAIALFVPKGLNVFLGDVVEVKSGRYPERGDIGLFNTVTRIVQKNGDKDTRCWWDPKDDRLWLRVIYCDWMPGEGWIKQTGLYPAWYKPAAASPSMK